MGLIIKGSIKVKSSEEELAYSEDRGVVAGARRAGCGWVPLGELERVDSTVADIVTVRTLAPDESTRARDIGDNRAVASANLFVVRTCIKEVRTAIEGRVVRLQGDEAIDWVNAIALENPTALDLLADRIRVRSRSGDVEADYRANRKLFGKPQPPEEKEGQQDDGASKSGGAG